MPACSRLRYFTISLVKNPAKQHYCSFLGNLTKTQIEFSKTFYPNIIFNESQLLECLVNRNFHQARQLLDQMSQRGNQSRVATWTSLLSKFSKFGLIDEARALFEIMPARNVVTYNAMLSGYVQSNRLIDAYRFFGEMPERNVVSWTSMLCGLMNSGRVDEGKRLFEVMPERNVVTWNSMIVGLIRNGDLEGARCVFYEMPVKDLVSWNAMIGGYAENCMIEEAKALFDRMEDKNVVTWTTLIAGCCRVGDVESAYKLFSRMPTRNVVSWTAMISGFAWNHFYREALLTFLEMRNNDVKPNKETLVSLAYACAGLGFPHLGMQVHAHIIVNHWEYHDYDGRLFNSLIYMYSEFGMMDHAGFVFFRHPRYWTIQSCNYMVNGYIQIQQLQKAQYIFDIVPFRDNISWTSMVKGYCNAGLVVKASELFNNMPDRDAVAWTVIISGHVENELFLEANHLFLEMRMQGISPLQSTYSTLLGAAGAMAHLDQGKQLHCLLMKSHSILDLILQNSLISMYAKCGQLDDAYSIFSNMAFRDLISWNSMIMGYSHHGIASEALKLFEAMTRSGIKPNSVTFLGILSACSHAGLIDQGLAIYRAMGNMYGIQPKLEHHICMINLLGRAGKVDEAEEFVLRLPSEQGVAVWGTLLGICGFDEINADIARRASKQLLKLDPLNVPAHVVLCNIHASNGQYEVEGTLRKDMRLKSMKKVPGCSWISRGGQIHVFFSGDKSLQDDELSLL